MLQTQVHASPSRLAEGPLGAGSRHTAALDEILLLSEAVAWQTSSSENLRTAP